MQQKKLIQILDKIFIRNKIFFYILIITISSTVINFYSGYRGVFPIDSFLIYDSGYKILNGFHPFKDYWSITGPILDYIQFIFFKLFGVNWFSYVLHATVLNVTISLTVFFFFLKIGIKKFYSLLYAISTSILAYPSVGTPFMDHHSAIFSLIAVIFLFLSIQSIKNNYWFLIPIFLFSSFLSKQIPSAYLSILFLIIVLIFIYLENYKRINFLFQLLLGGIVPAFLLTVLFWLNDIPFKNFFTQYIFFPYEIGAERSSKLGFDLNNIFSRFKFIYFSLMPLFLIAVKMYSREYLGNHEVKKDFLLIFLTIFSVFIFIYSQILTNNQILIFFLVPFCLGVSHYFVEKYFNKKIIINFLLIILLISTFKFHIRFNENKKFMEFTNTDFKTAVDAEILDKSLKGLNWISSNYKNSPNIEINLLKEAKQNIKADLSNKIIISDYQILQSISGIKEIAPNKWFDVLSVPDKKNKYFDEYKNFFIKKVLQQNISTIYVVGDKELFLKDMFDTECFERKKINEIVNKLSIKECLN